MIILGLRTDKPEAELFVYEGSKKLAELKWQAHLKLAETLNARISEILNKSSISPDQISGIAVYKGPGSFTGLRIGLSVANALAYAWQIPIVATTGERWMLAAIDDLTDGKNNKIAMPEYGSPAHVTRPKK